jgi:hypothetical protein
MIFQDMESVHDIVGYDINNGGMEVSQKVLKLVW